MADKKRNKKKKRRAEQDDETGRTEDKETESKQEVESAAEETAAEASVIEDEGRNHCVVHVYLSLFLLIILIHMTAVPCSQVTRLPCLQLNII